MADDETITLTATFSTRVEADLAVKRLAQQLGVSTPDISMMPSSNQNTTAAGSSRDDLSRVDAPSQDETEISVLIIIEKIPIVQRILGDCGAIHVSGKKS